MRNRLLTVLLVSFTARATSAQVIGSAGSDAKELLSEPAPTLLATSSGHFSNSVLAEANIDHHGTLDLGSVRDEPLVPRRKLWSADGMEVDGGVGWSFVLPDSIQAQRETLFRKLDLLLPAKTRSPPVLFGINRELKFVEHQENQPGIPAPVGLSYHLPEQWVKFFGELTPILDPALSTFMGWGAGIGIRFNF